MKQLHRHDIRVIHLRFHFCGKATIHQRDLLSQTRTALTITNLGTPKVRSPASESLSLIRFYQLL